jgi:4-amino-4-deoxy-L-arabinose transferase-like glycosyltransferase
LFYHIGAPALFEPDEGRNAEKARELLLIGDWVTPHQDFLPVLDKPIFFYWLVALSYKFFGISEATARLPLAIAALGCIVLMYRVVKSAFGFWEALWGALVLVTSVEFFLLARVVILDMTLTFFTTLALCCFYWGLHADRAGKRCLSYWIMYAAMAAATLVKGLVGIALPGMIITAFLVLTRRLAEFKRIPIISGTIIFLLISAPWYVLVELRNPGYLRYFFWEEHFVRS